MPTLTNDFLPFGTAGGAPVLSNAAYAAIAPANGFPAGILLKEHLNKALRQSCVMAAALGQFMNNQGISALDDGSVPNLATALAAAMNSAQVAAPTTSYRLAVQAQTGASRTVHLTAGVWQLSLIFSVLDADLSGNSDLTFAQTVSLTGGGITYASTPAVVHLYRYGGAGFGRIVYGVDIATIDCSISTVGDYLLQIANATVTGANTSGAGFNGAIATLERIG